MSETTRTRLLLIVTGSTLRAEQVDRPLAYFLKQQAEAKLAELGARFEVLVLADFRWLNDEGLQRLPTISVGGPGVNALARQWLEEMPVSLAVDDQYFIQMDPDLDELRASIWGMTNATTQIAVSAFLNRFLPRFLDRCQSADPVALDDEDEDTE
ncbi:MAG TPA: hypothetical protein VG406_26160 [Isosphaeraceae bacterium]|jgi:hypothetical protein|nr:hypothetical protein [Isosphaeraceae bacterium]